MTLPAEARPRRSDSRNETLRAVVYGFALIIAAPRAWTAGQTVAALFIGGVAVLGIGLEVIATRRRDQGR